MVFITASMEKMVVFSKSMDLIIKNTIIMMAI